MGSCTSGETSEGSEDDFHDRFNDLPNLVYLFSIHLQYFLNYFTREPTNGPTPERSIRVAPNP